MELVEYTNVLIRRRTKCLSFRGVPYSEVLTSLRAENQVYFIERCALFGGSFFGITTTGCIHYTTAGGRCGLGEWGRCEGGRETQ